MILQSDQAEFWTCCSSRHFVALSNFEVNRSPGRLPSNNFTRITVFDFRNHVIVVSVILVDFVNPPCFIIWYDSYVQSMRACMDACAWVCACFSKNRILVMVAKWCSLQCKETRTITEIHYFATLAWIPAAFLKKMLGKGCWGVLAMGRNIWGSGNP